MNISTIFDNIKKGIFNLGSLKELYVSQSDAFKTDADIAPIMDKITGWLGFVAPYMAYILLAVGLVVALFGKKLLPLGKFVGFFLVGFGAGVLYLSPLVDKLFEIPSWIVGLIIGVVAALLCKIFYYIVVAFASGYAMYSVCYSASVLPQLTGYTKGNTLYSIIAGVVAIVLVLLLLKWLEMLGTAYLGGYLFAVSLNTATKFMSLDFIKSYANIVFWVIVGIVALVGFIVQVKTRRRY